MGLGLHCHKYRLLSVCSRGELVDLLSFEPLALTLPRPVGSLTAFLLLLRQACDKFDFHYFKYCFKINVPREQDLQYLSGAQMKVEKWGRIRGVSEGDDEMGVLVWNWLRKIDFTILDCEG